MELLGLRVLKWALGCRFWVGSSVQVRYQAKGPKKRSGA